MRKAKEMPYHRGLVVKLYPSDRQKHIIALNDGAKRAVYNFLVATNNELYQLRKVGTFCLLLTGLPTLIPLSRVCQQSRTPSHSYTARTLTHFQWLTLSRATTPHGKTSGIGTREYRLLRRNPTSSPIKRMGVTIKKQRL